MCEAAPSVSAVFKAWAHGRGLPGDDYMDRILDAVYELARTGLGFLEASERDLRRYLFDAKASPEERALFWQATSAFGAWLAEENRNLLKERP